MAEVKLLLKVSSEQSKRKMLQEGHEKLPVGYDGSLVIATTVTLNEQKEQ